MFGEKYFCRVIRANDENFWEFLKFKKTTEIAPFNVALKMFFFEVLI